MSKAIEKFNEFAYSLLGCAFVASAIVLDLWKIDLFENPKTLMLLEIAVLFVICSTLFTIQHNINHEQPK